jgi:hypothetical protein
MAKHKYIESPEKMWELFEAYRYATKSNPFLVQDYVGKDGDMVYRERERPLTFEGFKNYARKEVGCIKQYFDNEDNRYNEYMTICHACKEEIRQDQIEGGMASVFNASITQRLNGLADKKELDVKGEPRIFNL